MRIRDGFGLILSVLAVAGVARADFQYTESTKVTGGSLIAMTKSLGVFSKSARQINEPQTSTIMVKGNRMRSEHSAGTVEIIDLDAKRFINIDTNKKTYTVMTFEQFRANLERAEAQAKEQQEKAVTQHPEAANIKITPKVHSEQTGATRTILDLPTTEVKWQIEMEMESTDPKIQQQAQSASMTMNTDAWMAPTIPGYDEVRQFYMRMAKQLDWLPGTMGGMMGMNPQMGPAMKEFQKNMAAVKGMPLLQTMSFGLAATGIPQNQGAAPNSSSPPPPPPQQTGTSTSVPTSARDAIGKGMGSVFGGFGRKKKHDQDAQAADSSASASQPSNPGALMEMQTSVTQYANNPIDPSLFDIPPGYVQIQPDPNQIGPGPRRQ